MSLADGDTNIKLSDLTPTWLKENYLTGLQFLDTAGMPIGDTFFDTHLQNAVRKLETICDISILELVITGEQHDYRIGDFYAYAFLQTYKQPVREVKKVRAVYPVGNSIAEYPDEWIQITPNGQINLVPQRGALGNTILGAGGDFLPLMFAGLSYVPSLWEIDYTAGMDSDNLPRMVVEAIAKLAAIDVLAIMSDLTRPIGINSESLSIDGLSQSQSYQAPAFQARIERYKEDLYGPQGRAQELAVTSGLLKQILDYYRPINMASLY